MSIGQRRSTKGCARISSSHIAQAAGENNDFADDAETAGYGLPLTRSLARTGMKGERPLGMHWHPERPFQKHSGSLREELNAFDVVSGSSAKSAKSLFSRA